ncbi:hypothetical protein S225a_18130 [Candidatus Brocadiaceae bacterium S225]|nr:hypothetical protein S225a_18130 [Candidatus Brocadiaceae bacterium S225]
MSIMLLAENSLSFYVYYIAKKMKFKRTEKPGNQCLHCIIIKHISERASVSESEKSIQMANMLYYINE